MAVSEDMDMVVQALRETDGGGREDERLPRVSEVSGSPYVTLPVGVVAFSPSPSVVDTAEVRELTGYDEEALTRAKSPGHALEIVLGRAVVRVGDDKCDAAMLRKLSMSDRVSLLLAIRTVTWGEEASIFAPCEVCQKTTEQTVVASDVPQVDLADKIADRRFDKRMHDGTVATLQWPSGEFHRKLLMGELATDEKMSTALIADTLVSYGDFPLVDENLAKSLSMRTRRDLLDAVTKKAPGPDLDKVRATCAECGEETEVRVPIGALFPV